MGTEDPQPLVNGSKRICGGLTGSISSKINLKICHKLPTQLENIYFTLFIKISVKVQVIYEPSVSNIKNYTHNQNIILVSGMQKFF